MIPRNLHRRIADAFGSHLMQAPHQYGAPLRKTLIGYWKFRVGDYRAVYKIDEQEMLILGIRHRKSVYEDILQRVSPIRALLSHPSDTAATPSHSEHLPFLSQPATTVSPSCFKGYLTGSRPISWKIFLSIAEVFGVSKNDRKMSCTRVVCAARSA